MNSIQRLGQKSLKNFVGFLVQMTTPKSPFEINWPLANAIFSRKCTFLWITIFNIDSRFAVAYSSVPNKRICAIISLFFKIFSTMYEVLRPCTFIKIQTWVTGELSNSEIFFPWMTHFFISIAIKVMKFCGNLDTAYWYLIILPPYTFIRPCTFILNTRVFEPYWWWRATFPTWKIKISNCFLKGVTHKRHKRIKI